ncbi:hypothetical protein [Streptomyces sp. NPDC050287]|uniref:hypothetical protein n=1 Tax=Streptomyces sp. NPDC050287 TaxID=3365608 RepID=UPI0037B7AC8C
MYLPPKVVGNPVGAHGLGRVAPVAARGLPSAAVPKPAVTAAAPAEESAPLAV